MILIMFQIKRKSENFKFDYSTDPTWKTVIAVYFFFGLQSYQVTFYFGFLFQYNQKNHDEIFYSTIFTKM